MTIVKASDIKNEEQVKLILDGMKPRNEYLDTISENSYEYESICENIQEQFWEIYDFLNISKMKFTANNIFTTELMNFIMWDYLKEEISFNKLLKELNQKYKKID